MNHLWALVVIAADVIAIVVVGAVVEGTGVALVIVITAAEVSHI